MEELEERVEELQRLKQELEHDTLICTECMRRFETKTELKDHYGKKHKQELETSSSCQKSRMVRKINRHLCQLCAKHFGDSWTLRHHQRTVHLEAREHQCGQCEKSFLSHKDMTRHVRGVHLGQKIVFPGSKRGHDDALEVRVSSASLMQEGRVLPNILKKADMKSRVNLNLPGEDQEMKEGTVEEIIVEVEENGVTASTEPPIFQLENLENLQFVLQEGSGEPQIIIPETGIRLTIPGQEQEAGGNVLHLVPEHLEQEAGPPALVEEQSQGLFGSEEFNLPPDLSLSPPPSVHFEPVDEKVVTEVKFDPNVVDHPKKFIYKKVLNSSSPHLVAVKELTKAPRSIEQFKCNYCNKCFISGAFLEKHIRLIHAEPTADLGFIRTMINGNLESLELNSDYINLDTIVNMDVDDDPGSSSIPVEPEKTENENLILESEDAFQDPIREVSCKTCQKLFANKLALSKHRKSSHKRHQKHKCEDCGSEFTSRQTLRAHMSSIHEGIKKVCSICLKPVADLIRHVRSQHKTVKKKEFVCDTCQTPFRTGFSLQRHIDTVHMKLKAWLCDLCEKTFGEKRDMLRHKNAVHFGIKNTHPKWTCPECNIVFKLRREYDDHKTTFHASLTEDQVVKFLNAELESKKQKFHISTYKL